MSSDLVVVSWSSIYTTLVVSAAQGLVFYCFFIWQRNRDERDGGRYDLYEPRQYFRQDRSPEPFLKPWWKEAWMVSDEETLRCVGLDSYMYLRFLRLGARIAFVGVVFAIVLIPIYATADNPMFVNDSFSALSLAKVSPSGDRLWVTLSLWIAFTIFILYEFWMEWINYAGHRYDFLARGDPDIPQEYRYSIRVERIPYKYRNNAALREYFEKLFPGKVKQVMVYCKFEALQKLVDERQANIEASEKAVAFTHAKPDKPRPRLRLGGPCNCDRVDAIEHYNSEIKRLNEEIDSLRTMLVLGPTDVENMGQPDEDAGAAAEESEDDKDSADHNIESNVEVDEDPELPNTPADKTKAKGSVAGSEHSDPDAPLITRPSSTAFVTFTSLRAKQAAVQCELTGKTTSMIVYPAADPKGILWNNATVPQPVQRVLQFQASLIWVVGIFFWAFIVSFVVAVSNLNSILSFIGLRTFDENTFWYGVVSGWLPVVSLMLLDYVLYLLIVSAAKYFIRYKALPEVDSYAVYWYMMFQIANLFYVLIGGSLFNEINALSSVGNLTEAIRVVAHSLSGSSVFFINVMLYEVFGTLGLEISMLPTYGFSLLARITEKAEAMRTQRMIDESHQAPAIEWGQQLPPIVFIFLVTIIYMPIVPIVECFALLYFTLTYVLWKHQCLHVYAQEFEGGGDATWKTLFYFLMACLYIGQIVFIVCMAIKEAGIQVYLAIIPLGLTLAMHVLLYVQVIKPLHHLSLEVAAEVDIMDGELESVSTLTPLYGPPALFKDEREPMPYRRSTKPSS